MQKYLSVHQAAHNPNPNFSQYRTEPNELSQYISEDKKASHYFAKPNIHEILYQRRLEKDMVMLKPEPAEKDSRLSRTARPEEIKEIVNNLYIVRERKDDVNQKRIQ